ncbi:MAG: ATP-binding protein [Proteobacteria bacterium]|nr:ATP-binding protein [Pseudomonadota bacterium]
MSEEELANVDIKEDFDIVKARATARSLAAALGFEVVDQTRIATAVSEIARNALIHGGGGKMTVGPLDQKKGLEIVIIDQGSGIPDIDQAMKDGYSTTGGLGLGLGGAKRLMDELYVESSSVGTKVTMRKWLLGRLRR